MNALQLSATIFAIVMAGLFILAVLRKSERNKAEEVEKLRRHCDEKEPSLVGRPYGKTNYQGIQIVPSPVMPEGKAVVLTNEVVTDLLTTMEQGLETVPTEKTSNGVQFLFNFDSEVKG